MADKLSGQITVVSAGTAVQGPSSPSGLKFVIKGHPDNAGNVAFGNDGSDDITMDNGMVLAPGEKVEATFFGGYDNALNAMWFNADTGSDVVCWLKVG